VADTATTTDVETPEFLDTIKQSIDAAVKPLNDQITGLNQKLETQEQTLTEMKKPVKNASQLFGGGAPAVRQGEDSLSSRGYSYARIMQGIANRNFEKCKYELEVSQKLADAYGMQGADPGTVFVPLGGAHMQQLDDSDRAEIRAAVRQGVANVDIAEVMAIRQHMLGGVNQAATTYDDTNLGLLLGPIQQGEMIDLLRSKEIFTRAGATEFTLPANGAIRFPENQSDADGFWVGEGQEISETSLKLGAQSMYAKKLGSIVTYSSELVRFTSMATEAFIRNEIAYGQAKRLDITALTGVGTQLSPKGLLNYSNIVTHTASTVQTDGDVLEPEDIPILLAKIAQNDVDTEGAAVIMTPLLQATTSFRRADSVSAGDKRGPLVFPYTERNGVQTLSGARVLTSTRIPSDRAKGSSTNLTLVLAGVFREFLIGRVGVMEFKLNDQSGTNFKNDMVSIRAIQHVDTAPRRPQAFGIIDDLDPNGVYVTDSE